MRSNLDPPPYAPVRDMGSLKDLLTEKMEDYALEPGAAALDLVLFHDALLHVCRIHRILSQPRGNALLVGVGGSGRKSLARLAAFVAELKVFSIEITRTYRHTEFREDLKGLYRLAGVTGKPTLFLFDETQVGAVRREAGGTAILHLCAPCVPSQLLCTYYLPSTQCCNNTG
jgi:dynein heavy chain